MHNIIIIIIIISIHVVISMLDTKQNIPLVYSSIYFSIIPPIFSIKSDFLHLDHFKINRING